MKFCLKAGNFLNECNSLQGCYKDSSSETANFYDLYEFNNFYQVTQNTSRNSTLIISGIIACLLQ